MRGGRVAKHLVHAVDGVPAHLPEQGQRGLFESVFGVKLGACSGHFVLQNLRIDQFNQPFSEIDVALDIPFGERANLI